MLLSVELRWQLLIKCKTMMCTDSPLSSSKPLEARATLQLVPSQTAFSIVLPAHGRPPLRAAWRTRRTLCLTPVPHLALHSPHSSQWSARMQFTAVRPSTTEQHKCRLRIKVSTHYASETNRNYAVKVAVLLGSTTAENGRKPQEIANMPLRPWRNSTDGNQPSGKTAAGLCQQKYL